MAATAMSKIRVPLVSFILELDGNQNCQSDGENYGWQKEQKELEVARNFIWVKVDKF